MPLNAESKYPNRRAYVLKVRSDAAADALAGRLENLVTGGWREFATGQELLESIASDLQTGASEGLIGVTKKLRSGHRRFQGKG